jgi:hypothetical protein
VSGRPACWETATPAGSHRLPHLCGSLQLPREGRRVWRYDSRPADIHSSVRVGMGGEPARHAEEPGLGTTVGSLAMPTAATGLTGVRGIYRDQAHTDCLRLVGDEGPELSERPTVQDSPLAFATNRCPTADAPEVFQRNAASGAFRRLHKGLADTVVHITRKAALPATAPLQEALGAACPFLLEAWRAAAHSGRARC